MAEYGVGPSGPPLGNRGRPSSRRLIAV